MSEAWSRRVQDPDGRVVVFDAESHLHLAKGIRSWLLDHVDIIVGTVERPDYRDDDPRAGRERFYRQDFPIPGQWLRVVVDFEMQPAPVITALIQPNDPRPEL